MSFNIYLTFDGTCREAFEFYQSVFGGEFQDLQTFGDAPAQEGMSPADPTRIMHMSLPMGDNTLMGSDTMAAGGVTVGDNFSISLSPASKAESDRLFNLLSAGGEVTMPMSDTFWNAYFGAFRDRFGINWMINHESG